MMTLVVCCCPDGHYHHVVYDIGPFIADYPEQVMLVGVVQGWCPRCVPTFMFVTGVLINAQWFTAQLFPFEHRCTSKTSDLDGEGGHRTHALTDLLVSSPEIGTADLWDSYGIDDDVVVRTSISFWLLSNSFYILSHLPTIFHTLTSMKVCRRTCCIKLSRAHSRSTWLLGYATILWCHTVSFVPMTSSMTLIGGWYTFKVNNVDTNMIPRLIAMTPPFPGLWRFKHGWWFKQWTGDDSKALMKVSTILSILCQFTNISPGLHSIDCRVCAPADCQVSRSIFGLLLPCMAL